MTLKQSLPDEEHISALRRRPSH